MSNLFEVRAISNDLVFLNQNTEEQSMEQVLAETGHIVSVLHMVTKTLDYQMAVVELGENHVVIRYGVSDELAIEGDIWTHEDEVRFELRGGGVGFIERISPTEVTEGFYVRLAR